MSGAGWVALGVLYALAGWMAFLVEMSPRYGPPSALAWFRILAWPISALAGLIVVIVGLLGLRRRTPRQAGPT